MGAATAGTPLVLLARVARTTAWHAKVPPDLGAMGLLLAGSDTRRHRRRRRVEWVSLLRLPQREGYATQRRAQC
jgi:hypothetical protein